MRLTKTIKRIVAIGAGATMVGATIMGAMAAADLATYPSPFVKDGKFGALIVVGDQAKADDVLGSIDIATSLQYAAKTPVTVAGSTAASVQGSVKIEVPGQKLHYGATASSVKESVTASDWPTLLKQGTLTNTDGTSFKYNQRIIVPAVKPKFDKSTLDLDKPALFLDWTTSTPSYTLELAFPTAVNFTKCVNKVMTIAGKEYTLSGNAADLTATSIVLYGGGIDKTLNAGEKATLTVGSTDVPVEVVGVNTQSTTSKATITVNGETAEVTKGETTLLGGIRVYIRDIMAYTAPATSGAVRMFVGTDKVTLEDGENVKIGTSEVELDGVKAYFSTSSGKVTKINLTTTPAELDPEVKGTAVKGELVDPFSGQFKIMYVGPNPALDGTSKDVIKLTPSSTNAMKLAFKSKSGKDYNVQILLGNSTATGVYATTMAYMYSSTHKFVMNGGNVYVDDVFPVTSNGYTYILQLDSVKNTTAAGQVITVKDLGDGSTTTATYALSSSSGTGTFQLEGHSFAFTAYPTGTQSTSYITVAAETTLYTAGGALITLPNAASFNTTANSFNLTVTEETSYNSVGTPDNHGVISTIVTYDSTITSGNKIRANTPIYGALDTTSPLAWDGLISVGDTGNDKAGVTPYGSYVTFNDDTSNYWVEIQYAGSETEHQVFFAPVAAEATTGGGDGATYYETTPINVGSAVLASEVTNVRAQNVILVGGPCANAAASDIMGSPTDCAAGFVEGKATLKLFENNGNVALLVAGYSAMDTRRAARVLADHVVSGKYDLKGTEMVISGTSWSDITVAAPTVA